MPTADKLLERMRNNSRDWRIEDLLIVAKRYGIGVRKSSGSHVHFFHEDMIAHISVPAHKPIKPVYIEKFIDFLDALKEKTS
jgi:predicted RNA binding protein YcfA (HicA-like mRNA interferase family)